MNDDDVVFRALADPTRRLLLDRLFERDGRTLTELESQLEMTRFGVMKHLRILEEAGLVVSRKAGPEPAALPQPGADPADPRPLDRQVQRAPRVSARGAQDATGGNGMTTITEIQTTQVYQIFIKATPEEIWEAITKPEFTEQYFHGVRVERRGRDGAFRAAGRRRVGRRGGHRVRSAAAARARAGGRRGTPSAAEEPASRVTWEIEEQDGVSMLTVVHDQLEGAPKTAAGVAGGWMRVSAA